VRESTDAKEPRIFPDLQELLRLLQLKRASCPINEPLRTAILSLLLLIACEEGTPLSDDPSKLVGVEWYACIALYSTILRCREGLQPYTGHFNLMSDLDDALKAYAYHHRHPDFVFLDRTERAIDALPYPEVVRERIKQRLAQHESGLRMFGGWR
jgi:hypothetical protein